MSTLYVNNIDTESGTDITIPTGKKLVVTDSGGLAVPGTVVQIQYAESTSQVSWTSQDTETFIFQGSITPKFSTSKILAVATVGGLSNGGSGRLSGRIRWDTSSGGTSGTQITGLVQTAMDGAGTSHLDCMGISGLTAAVGTTSTLYFKVTMTKGDSGGTMYACQYGSASQLNLFEIAQ